MAARDAARTEDVHSRIFCLEPRLALRARGHALAGAGSNRQIRASGRRSAAAAIQPAIGRDGKIQRQRDPLGNHPLSAQTCQRPLAVRCGAFGDMVLLTALIRVLHAEFDASVDIITSGPWSEPLLRGQPGVGEVFSMRSRKTPYWLSSDQQRVVRQLRARAPSPTWFCDSDAAARPVLDR